jgi:ParB family transcriptional regulator, chromosome partitioning protein
MSKQQRSVLGKGLSALIPGAREDNEAASEELRIRNLPHAERPRAELAPEPQKIVGVSKIEIARIAPNPLQPRKEFSEDSLRELTSSIKEHGVIQPVTVRARPGGSFELVSGERRMRASIEAGLTEIPAYVLDVDTDRKMLELAIIENVQRQQFNPIEEAEAYQRLIEECDLTQEEVAEKIAKDRSTITNFLRLLRLPEEIKESLRKGQLGMGHAKAVMSVPNADRQVMLWQEAIHGGYSVRKIEEAARAAAKEYSTTEAPSQGGRPQAKTVIPPARDTTHLLPIENSIKQQLGTQVKIRFKTNEAGEIAIEFYNHDDLERLTELLMSIEHE